MTEYGLLYLFLIIEGFILLFLGFLILVHRFYRNF